ncbi:MAG: hypothetical protein JXR78_15675 [Victivallales bacterium]|nr:hypothetical protein [Victivallales bacterium]
MKKTIVVIFCVLISCVWNVFGGNPIISVDFSKPGKSYNQKAKGSFSGSLPEGVIPDFPAWNKSNAHAELINEGNVKFLRFNVKNVDHSVLFRLSNKKITVPGYYELTLRYRSSASPVNLHIRQLGKPYKNFWEKDVPISEEWKEEQILIDLREKAKSAFSKSKLDSSHAVLYLSLKEGVTDISSIKLQKSDKKAYDAYLETSEKITRPPKGTKNYFSNSRFPLGLPSGWSINRQNVSGKTESDAKELGPSGMAALKITSNEPITVFSAPFQTADPKQPVHVSFMYKADGNWHFSCGGEKKVLKASNKWTKAVLSFNPGERDSGYHVAFAGKGTLYLDSLMAYTGAAQTAYTSAGECEIALAPADFGISHTRVQFMDETPEVKYYASGRIGGAILKGNVVNIYNEKRPIKAIRLDEASSGVIDYGLFPEKQLGPFRIELWAEKNGKRISLYSEIVMNRVRRPLYWGKDAPDSPFGGHFYSNERVVNIMKAGGMNWQRFHDACQDGTAWAWLEPERGKWVFADDKIARYRKANIKILGDISSAPEWASFFHGARHHYNYFDKMYQPKDMEAFKNYVRTVVSRYKGVIDEYQVWNEPWSTSFWHKLYNQKKDKFLQGEDPAGDYTQLSKIAYTEIKNICPDITVYGFNTQGGQAGTEWTKECFDAGAYEFCDMIDFHYYNQNSQLNGFPGDPVSQAYNNAVGYIKKHVQGSMKPVVQSEANPIRGGAVPLGLAGSDSFTGMMKYSMPWEQESDPAKVADIACRFIIAHLRLGVKRIFLYSDHTYHHMLRPPSFPVLLGADGYPHPVFSAFSNMAWLLEDRPFCKEEKIGDKVWAYVFAGRGKSVAVITGMVHGKYSLKPDSQWEIIDLFGNPVKGSAEYKGEIFYVVSGMNPKELSAALKDKSGK